LSNPQPTLTLDDLRTGARQIATRRHEARRDYERYMEQEADAEREYRTTLAKAFARERAEGQPAGAAEITARGEAAEAKHKAAIAGSLAKSALLRIDECEREASTLRSIADWSQRIDGGAA
jgi:hypothetical protein